MWIERFEIMGHEFTFCTDMSLGEVLLNRSNYEASKSFYKALDAAMFLYTDFRYARTYRGDEPFEFPTRNIPRHYTKLCIEFRQQLIASIQMDQSIASKLTTKPKTTKCAGYVYLLQSPTHAYKIGKTKNPDNRRKTFSVKLPFEVNFLALIKTENMEELERSLHEHFASKRVNGEWFALSDEDVQYIKGLAEVSNE